jgi:hypothetical protein
LSGQRFSLDPLRALSYIGACALLAACPGPRRLAPLVPAALPPANRDSAVAWARRTLPPAPTLIRFRWRYQDERVKYAGRGSARIAPPDSLRFDYAGSLGLGSGAAVIIGDSVAWADPEKNLRSLVPAIPMLWAALGMVQPPRAEAEVFGLSGRMWRFTQLDDTLDFVAVDSVLEAEWRSGGKMVARSRSQFDAQGRPASARVDFPEASARFELTVGVVEIVAEIPAALWRSRR